MSRCCVADLTHVLQTSSSNQTQVLHVVASNNVSLSCLEGRIYIYFIKSIASTHYFIKSTTSSRCVEDTPGYTLVHTLVHDKYLPACWMSRKLRPERKTIPCYTTDRFKSSCLQFVDKVNSLSTDTSIRRTPGAGPGCFSVILL